MTPITGNLGLLAAALLTLATALLCWPQLGTLLAGAILYLNLLPIATMLHGAPHFVVVLSAALVVPPLFKHWVVDRDGVILDRPFLLMLAFLASTIISSCFAKRQELAVLWLARYVAEGILVYFLFINLIRDERSLRRFTWGLVGCGALLASLTVYQELTGSYTNEFGGLAGRETAHDLLLEGYDRGDRSTIKDAHRAQGPSLDANRYAQILIVLLPLGWCLIKNERRLVQKIIAAGCSALILAGTLLTYSRGAFVGLVVVVCLMGILRMATVRQILVAAAALLVFVTLLSPGYVGRIVSLRGVGELIHPTAGSEVEADPVERSRATLMLAAWRLFLDHPILGAGPGQFSGVYSVDYASELYGIRRITTQFRAHSLYLEMAAETGVVGLALFLAIVASTLMRLAMAARHTAAVTPLVSNWSAALVIAISAYLVTALFLHLSYQRYYWIMLALAGVTVRLAENRSARSGTTRDEMRTLDPQRFERVVLAKPLREPH